jgi:phospholipid/cholesterol/gamma-HCH transport system ATP-binding protein
LIYPVLQVSGLVNRFGTQVVHDGLDMEVRADEVFGIVGGSGAGKSVLLRTILGLQRPLAGTVRIDGSDITRMSVAQLRSVKAHYGVTFQQGALYSALTVLQNVQLPMIEHLGLGRTALEELALLRIRLVGLPAEAARKYPAELSGGMVKRAALARALALDPRLLFLDEPTSGLDPVSAAAFDELVLYLQKQLRLTIVMITHDLDTIFRTCNRVGVIVDGRMESDTLERIVDYPHPWIRAYFHGERERARLGAARGTWSELRRSRCLRAAGGAAGSAVRLLVFRRPRASQLQPLRDLLQRQRQRPRAGRGGALPRCRCRPRGRHAHRPARSQPRRGDRRHRCDHADIGAHRRAAAAAGSHGAAVHRPVRGSQQ